MGPFPVVVFLSAFLLFQVQPILGRFVLPWFGGTPAVWTTCLLFFQAALLAGYLYAHWLSSLRSLRTQATIHIALLAVSLATLPIIPNPELWKPSGAQDPVGRILWMLAATAGAPYFLLSSTAPLLQRWFTATSPGAPWRLYSLSNLGSFLALLSYPIVIERTLRLRVQATTWTVGYVLFALACAWLAWSVRGKVAPAEDEAGPEEAPAGATLAFWIALSAVSTTVLMAVTSELSQEVAVSPFLWIAPLAIYLLTFVLTFDHPRWYQRHLFAVLAGVLAPVACVVTAVAAGISLWLQAAAYLGGLFAVCMLCHGELVLAKPSPRYLTRFYLAIAVGGVLGGLFSALGAPRWFDDYTEFPIAFGAACLLGFVGWLRTGALKNWTNRNIGLRVALMALLLGGVTCWVSTSGYRPPVATIRNFYGILRVIEPSQTGANGPERQLTHGRIKHGFQYLKPPQSTWPTSYYGPNTGIGLVLANYTKPARKVAVVGLGTGTIAAWGKTGDAFHYYEINPSVEEVAQKWFTYLRDSKGSPQVTLGDARVQMERELAAGSHNDYDVIAVDAFSSDSIPIHLLTAEFADICSQRLNEDGVLLFHISNRTLNLEPVVRGLAEHLGWKAAMFVNAQDAKTGEDGARWVLLTRNAEFLASEHIVHEQMGWTLNSPGPILWTDDFSSLWQVIRK